MSQHRVIRVLIAEDSPSVAKMLITLLQQEKDIAVIGHARDGIEALAITKKQRPDLITMDINMPNMDGLEATKRIMDECPTPIVVITSTVNEAELNITFNALKAGALSVLEKPEDILSSGFEENARSLITKIRAFAEIHVIRRPYKSQQTPAKIITTKLSKNTNYKILALGASTGGPAALQLIFSQLPKEFPIPIVVVQHITKGFLPGLVHWLQKSSQLEIKIVEDQEILTAGKIYFASDHYHLTIEAQRSPRACFDDSPAIEHFKPSISMLFNSLAKSYPGSAIGGLLTGMGKDGAYGLLDMYKKTCRTFIQNQSSSVVFGMPGYALYLQATNDIIDLNDIPNFLVSLFNGESS